MIKSEDLSMFRFLISTLLFCTSKLLGQTLIEVQISTKDTLQLEYYSPFNEFANDDIITIRKKVFSGRYLFTPTITSPTFIKLSFNSKSVELLVEPSDTVKLSIEGNTQETKKSSWLKIEGRNASGNNYYNLIYSDPRSVKFFVIDEIFSALHTQPVDQIAKAIQTEILRSTKWIDSLYQLDVITGTYRNYMKVQIQSLLAWEAGEQCNRYYEVQDPLSAKSKILKKFLFDNYNPLDNRLKTCLAAGYYHTYFQELSRWNPSPIDTNDVVVKDTPFYALASKDYQEYLWGSSLYANHRYNPDKLSVCLAFKKYRNRYGNNLYVSYMETQGICAFGKKEDVRILNLPDVDLFSFVKLASPGRRLLIDLWATWCKPCKIEFTHYTPSFYEFLSQFDIDLILISLDEDNANDKWKNEINTFKLNGYHHFSGKKLKQSIQDIVYDGGSIIIPKYLLVDKFGDIISIDFNRPSDKNFQQEISRLFRR